MKKHYLASLMILIGTHFGLACGDSDRASDKKTLRPYRFVVEDGWRVPGLDQAEVVSRSEVKNLDGFKDVETLTTPLFVTELRLHSGARVAIQNFEVDPDGKSIRLKPGYVEGGSRVSRYEIGGRTFLYRLWTDTDGAKDPAPMMPESPKDLAYFKDRVRKLENRKRLLRAGAVSGGILSCGGETFDFYDLDGDGKFETMIHFQTYVGGIISPVPPKTAEEAESRERIDHRIVVPNWAKHAAIPASFSGSQISGAGLK
jgi:hypothetical protein